jgi:hypothetical protein
MVFLLKLRKQRRARSEILTGDDPQLTLKSAVRYDDEAIE